MGVCKVYMGVNKVHMGEYKVYMGVCIRFIEGVYGSI